MFLATHFESRFAAFQELTAPEVSCLCKTITGSHRQVKLLCKGRPPLSPGLSQFLDEGFRLLRLHQNRWIYALRRQENQTLTYRSIHSDFLSACNPEPPGFIVQETDAFRTRGQLPVGVCPDVHNLYMFDINIGSFHDKRIEPVVDGQSF